MKVHYGEGVANGVANKSVGPEGCESSHHQLPGLGGYLHARSGSRSGLRLDEGMFLR